MKTLKKYYPYALLALCCCINTMAQAQDFFKYQTRQFLMVKTDHSDKNVKIGCHYDIHHSGIKYMSCDTLFDKRWIFVNANGIVNWHEDPLEARYIKVTDTKTKRYKSKLVQNRECDPFKVLKENNKVYYQNTRNLIKSPQFSLSMNDTLFFIDRSKASHLDKKVTSKYVVTGQQPFEFYFRELIVHNTSKIYYIKDTVLLQQDQYSNPYPLNCMVYGYDSWDFYSSDKGSQLHSLLYIEKGSYLPVMMYEEEVYIKDHKSKTISSCLIMPIASSDKYDN